MKEQSNSFFDSLFLSDEEKTSGASASKTTSSGLINRRNIIFIDTRVPDYESLTANIQPDTEVVILDPTKDGITQITESLFGKQYDSLHIVSHGSAGSLQLGSNYLNSGNLSQYQSQLQQWKTALTEEADILLYGCDVAAGETGVNFVQQLSQMTGADVAASNDLTGNAALGGDWDLEVKTGSIEAGLAFSSASVESYSSVLAISGDVIINEFSQGYSGGKEWVEILVVKDNLDLRSHRLVDGSGSLDIKLSGDGFSSLKAGTFIVLYNGADVDSTITPDLSYNPASGDYTLRISSQNTTGLFAVTRNINSGWNSTTGAFANADTTDVPRLLDASGFEIYKFPVAATGNRSKNPASSKASAFLGNTTLDATNAAKWSDDFTAAGGNPGLANGADNTAWINTLRGNIAPTIILNQNIALPAINEDILDTNNGGFFVTDLIKNLIKDSSNNNQGIAVADLSGDGNWQYSLNGGTTWTNFGAVSKTSATLLSGLTPIYSGTLGNTPDNQGWLQFGISPAILLLPAGGSQSFSNDTTNLISNQAGAAGYSNYNAGLPIALNPAFPVLDRNKGFTLSFNVKINSEDHSGDSNRAGFSVIVVTSDNTKAIELGFWENEIWAQTANPLFTHSTTDKTTFDTKSEKRYDLKIKDDTYQLFATDNTGTSFLFSGSLRNYTAFNHTTAGPLGTSLPYDPYERTNFVFLGDNTSSAQASVNLSRVELQTNAKVRFVPNANSNGNANITYMAWDGTDGKANGTTGVDISTRAGTTAYSDGSQVSIVTINAVNDAPTFSIGGNQSVQMGAGQKTVSAWAYSFNPGVNEASQNLDSYTVNVVDNASIFDVAPTIDATGKLTYTPTTSLPGTGTRSTTATIEVKAKDNGGTANGGVDTSAAQTFKITVYSNTINSVTATPNADTLTGTDGNDRIDGLAGDDKIYGGLGNDRIIGGAGNDTLYGDLENIPAYGVDFTMNDTIYGGIGNDIIYGNGGNDILYGEDGSDTIFGGLGDDEIWAGVGDDILKGEAGKDTFVLVRGQGKDTIQDFTPGQDTLGCAGGLKYGSTLGFTDINGDTLIRDTVKGLDVALVKGINAANLNQSSNFRLM
jgi:Ca2+-binding RTX toxin-like protein